MKKEMKTAVIVVDVQNDFCTGGKLAVKNGDQIIDPINRLTEYARLVGAPVIFTRDLHPRITTHFKDYGGVWPEHCVQGTEGAAFHKNLTITEGDIVVSKGMGDKEDAYSGFEARDKEGRLLKEILDERGVRRLIVCGLATDYCVKSTVLDGLKEGYQVEVFEDGIKAVNINPEDGRNALLEMKQKGAL